MATYPHCAVRVKVKKCEQNVPPEWRKFSVDPQITSLEVLYSLLAKAFDIKSDFSIKYKAFDPAGNELYLAVLSDWDLDAAFLRIHNHSIQTATEPCLTLQIDIKPFTEVREWDIDAATATSTIGNSSSTGGVSSGSTSVNAVSPNFPTHTSVREAISPLQQSLGASQKYVQNMQTKLPGLIMNHMEKTFSIVQKAFNLNEETMSSLPPRPPLADNEFRLFLDALGQIKRTDELRKVIFFGGIDPSLRRVVWKHILNVYPHGMNGHQRMEYMRRKAEHYIKLRDTWKNAVKQGCIAGELSYVTSMVKKDVLRTDRLHTFYAGSDDNQNIASLFNILTTYALNHPSVSYCQGMSDIASPLLVTMNDEAQAYICFCAIMTRLRGNFMLDGIAMTQKFAHLTEALSYYDPEFWEYLKMQQADDLLFCYRWLLLELKREFPFDDALHMLEVQWSSLKYETSVCKELNLFEKEFVPITDSSAPTTSSSLSSSYGAPMSPSYLLVKPRGENAYTKVCALRRQSSSASLNSLSSSLSAGTGIINSLRLDATKRLNQSLDDNMARAVANRQRHSSKAHQSLDESKMLLLLEGMEDVKNDEASNNVNFKALAAADADECVEDDGVESDDVFTSTNNSSNNSSGVSTRTNTTHFTFHPTNPFKDDSLAIDALPTKQPPTPDGITLVADNDNESGEVGSEVISEIGIVGKVPQIPKGIAKLQNKNILSNYNTVSNIIAKQIANASNVSESVRRVGSGGGGHFKDLKEKIAATSRKGLSFDELSNTYSVSNADKSQQKLVKNFNEFLNFAAINKNRIADKFSNTTPTPTSTLNSKAINTNTNNLPHGNEKSKTPSPTTTTTTTTTPHPLVQLKRNNYVSSLDESDSSSVPDTTWSGSTAATAIQQLQNASSYSLHLELASLNSSTAQTPEHMPAVNTCDGQKAAVAREAADARGTADAIEAPLTAQRLLANNGASKEHEGEALTEDNKNLTTETQLTPDDSQELEQDRDQEYYPMTTAITRELRLEAENLDRQVFGDSIDNKQSSSTNTLSDIEYEKLDRDSLDLVEDLKENEIVACPEISELLQRRRKRNSRIKSSMEPLQHAWTTDIDELSNGALSMESHAAMATQTHGADAAADVDAIYTNKLNPFIDPCTNALTESATGSSLPEVLVPISTETMNSMPTPIELATNAVDAITFAKSAPRNAGADTTPAAAAAAPASAGVQHATTTDVYAGGSGDGPSPPILPPPTEFGGGNPFLMFLCLTLLLQHRQVIMKSGMDYNEIAMHFDKMVRKHDVTRVLNQARRMYIDYLKEQNAYKQRMQQAAEARMAKLTAAAAAASATATGALNNDLKRSAMNMNEHAMAQQQRSGGSSYCNSTFNTAANT